MHKIHDRGELSKITHITGARVDFMKRHAAAYFDVRITLRRCKSLYETHSLF